MAWRYTATKGKQVVLGGSSSVAHIKDTARRFRKDGYEVRVYKTKRRRVSISK